MSQLEAVSTLRLYRVIADKIALKIRTSQEALEGLRLAEQGRLQALARAAARERQREYEKNLREYLGNDVLTTSGSAVVWWLARHLEDDQAVPAAVRPRSRPVVFWGGRGGSPGGAPGAVLRWFLSWWRTGWARGSGGCGDDHDPMERFEDLAGPGPVAGQPEPASPSTAAEPGGNVQHLEPQ